MENAQHTVGTLYIQSFEQSGFSVRGRLVHSSTSTSCQLVPVTPSLLRLLILPSFLCSPPLSPRPDLSHHPTWKADPRGAGSAIIQSEGRVALIRRPPVCPALSGPLRLALSPPGALSPLGPSCPESDGKFPARLFAGFSSQQAGLSPGPGCLEAGL